MTVNLKVLIFLFSFFCFSVFAQTPAFPTAEGYGKWATGGRGGQVVEVTTVEDNGTDALVGSLRWAVKQFSGQPLTVVFKVSGIIDLKGVEFRCKRNNVTFAGQTAPGDGICIKGESFNLGGSFNVIVRNMRFRTGAYTPAGVEVNAASFILENGGNFIIDHCSFSWSAEELCDLSDDIGWTTQYCVFSEGLYNSVNGKGARGYGPVIIGQGASFHHNLLASNVSRSPRFGVSTDVTRNVLTDFVNNINYNYGKSNSCYGGENEKGKFGSVKINFVNNYYKQGPAYPNTNTSKFVRASYEIGLQDTFYTKWHMSGNYIEGTVNAKLNSNNYSGLDFQDYTAQIPACTIENLMSTPHVMTEPVTTQSPLDAFNTVVQNSGALPYDTIDRRIHRETRDGVATFHGTFNNSKITGIIDKPEDAEGWPEYKTYNTVLDNDHDGMSDSWELANGLNPDFASDRNWLTPSGYTALEVYLNGLMGESINIQFNTDIFDVENAETVVFKQFEDKINFQSSEELKSVGIYTLSGIQMPLKFVDKTLDISSLSTGIYILSVNTATEKNQYFKVLKK